MKKLFILIILIIICGKVLNAIDNKEYNRAVERCGNSDNVVERYTNLGDKYFTCKVDK